MSKYRERVEAADFPGLVAKIRQRIGDTPPESKQGIADHGEPDLIERLELLLDHLLVVVSSTPPEVVAEGFLSDTTGLLNHLHDALEQVEVEPTAAEVTALASAIENVANDLMTWPAGAGEKEVTQAASTYRRSLGQQLVSTRDEMRALETEIATLKRSVEETRAANQSASEETATAGRTAINDIEQRVAVLGTRVDALDQQAESALARTNSAIDRFEQQFATSQAERKKAHDAQVTQYSADFDAALKALRAEAQKGLDVINANVAESGDLVTLFASAGTGNAYSQEANTQAEQAGLWRRAAVGLALVAVVVTGVVLFLDGDKNSVGIVSGRLALAAALGGLAAYAAKQSAQHRQREEVARRLALDIVAFGPFTKDLEDTVQDQARLDLSKRIFGQDQPNVLGSAPVLSAGHINLLSRLMDLIPKPK